MSTPALTPEQRVKELLSRLWEKHKAAVLERVGILEDAVRLGVTITPNDRERARHAAHKLAGSLGTFGYTECGEYSREIEHLLENPLTRLRMLRFAKLVELIRATLPPEQDRSPQPSSPEPNSPEGAPAEIITCDVLIIEDDELLHGLLAEAMTSAGFTSHFIPNGADAARALAANPPQVRCRLILLDVDLPGVDGLTLLRTIASQGMLSHTKVAMLTAVRGQKEVMEALGLGVCGFIGKPFEVPELIERVQSILGRT